MSRRPSNRPFKHSPSRPGSRAYRLTARTVTSLLVLAFTAATVSAAIPSGYKVYASTALHYRIAYPPSWHLSATQVYASFQSPSAQDATVVVAAVAVPIPSLDLYMNVLLKEKARTGNKIFNVTKTRVAGVDARLVNFASKSGRKTSLAVFATTGKLWQVSYQAAAHTYTRNLSVFKTMLASLTFT